MKDINYFLKNINGFVDINQDINNFKNNLLNLKDINVQIFFNKNIYIFKKNYNNSDSLKILLNNINCNKNFRLIFSSRNKETLYLNGYYSEDFLTSTFY